MKFKIKSDKPMPIAACIGIGAGAGLLLTVGLSALCAALVLRELFDQTALPIIRFAILVAASLVATISAALLAKGKWIPVIGVTASVYLAVLLAINAVLFNGVYSGVFATIVAVYGTAILTILAFLLAGKKGNKRMPKYRFG